jgi:hypothetical protein
VNRPGFDFDTKEGLLPLAIHGHDVRNTKTGLLDPGMQFRANFQPLVIAGAQVKHQIALNRAVVIACHRLIRTPST